MINFEWAMLLNKKSRFCSRLLLTLLRLSNFCWQRDKNSRRESLSFCFFQHVQWCWSERYTWSLLSIFCRLKEMCRKWIFVRIIYRTCTQLLVDAFTFTDDVLTKGAILLFTDSLNVEYPYSLHPYFCTLFWPAKEECGKSNGYVLGWKWRLFRMYSWY